MIGSFERLEEGARRLLGKHYGGCNVQRMFRDNHKRLMFRASVAGGGQWFSWRDNPDDAVDDVLVQMKKELGR